LKGAVVKPTLQNVFIQPLMPSTRLSAIQTHERTIMPLAIAVKKISSVHAVSPFLPVAATLMKRRRAVDDTGASR
jgi:hypothetical protein